MADLEKAWNRVLDRGSKKTIANLKNVHANNPRFQELLKNRGEEGGSPSAAAAKKVKVEPRKIIAVKSDSVRALNAARQQAYMAKGGRQPIGAMGSGGSNVMAGAGQSTIKDLKASIKAGFNPRVSLDPYESERAKKTGPRSLKMKKEEVEQVDEGSKRMSAAVKLQRAFKNASDQSAASRKRGEEVLAQARAEYAKKQAAKTNEEVEQVKEGAKEDAAELLGGPVKEKPKMPPGKQPPMKRYVRGLARKAMKAGMKKEEVEQTDEAKKPDASVVMTNQLRNKMISDKDKRTLGKVANLMAAQKKKVKEEVEQIDEASKENKAKKNAYIRLKGLRAMRAGKIDPARGHSPTRFGREMLKKEEVEQLSERSYLQYSGVIHSNDGNAKHGEEKDEGHHYTLTVPSNRDVGDHLSGKRAYSRVARENPHLEPHHVKAILQSTGNDREDVEVEHGGKTYKHRLYNNQDPDYIGEEVEQIDEVDYKKYLKVSQEKRPLTPSAVNTALSAEKEGNPNPARKLRNTQDARKFASKQLTKQVAKTRPAQKFPVYEPGRKYVGDSVELDGSVIDEDTEMKYIEEKLTAADPASKWISDFVKSDNPKFAGKSKKERIQQALGAYYAAKGGKNEEVEQIDEISPGLARKAAAASQVKAIEFSAYSGLSNLYNKEGKKEANRLDRKSDKAMDYIEKRQGQKGVDKVNRMVTRVVGEEAEGKTPETDTEVSLARMHGNPKKITYGDVVKARIASAKKKALNKG